MALTAQDKDLIRIARSMKLIRVGTDTVILDARNCKMPEDDVAEQINDALGYETLGTQLRDRKDPEEGLYLGPRELARIFWMRSIDPEIFVGCKTELTPTQTRKLVKIHLKM